MAKYKITMNPETILSAKTVYNWRYELKMELLEKRGYKSDWSGKPISNEVHMHEGLVTRGMCPKSLWWHMLIFAEPNCFLLLPEEHVPVCLPSREWCIQKSYEYYGRDVVREWYYSLPFKSFPFHLL